MANRPTDQSPHGFGFADADATKVALLQKDGFTDLVQLRIDGTPKWPHTIELVGVRTSARLERLVTETDGPIAAVIVDANWMMTTPELLRPLQDVLGALERLQATLGGPPVLLRCSSHPTLEELLWAIEARAQYPKLVVGDLEGVENLPGALAAATTGDTCFTTLARPENPVVRSLHHLLDTAGGLSWPAMLLAAGQAGAASMRAAGDLLGYSSYTVRNEAHKHAPRLLEYVRISQGTSGFAAFQSIGPRLGWYLPAWAHRNPHCFPEHVYEALFVRQSLLGI